jgi:hypothetical protein
MPMWFRGPDMTLRLVNSAYVKAVQADDAETRGPAADRADREGRRPDRRASGRQARDKDLPVERIVQATVGNQRRALRVSDLPLGAEGRGRLRHRHRGDGGAGARLQGLPRGAAFDARPAFDWRCAVRSGRRLAFANQPFLRIFRPAGRSVQVDPPDFDRFLDLARDKGACPKCAISRLGGASWRAGSRQSAPVEDAWSLSDSTHLRIVAQPMPDGGLVLVAEDRSEQLALSATRDTLLRTRTATFDSLFESLAVFAPDGRMQLWNRRFPEIWGIRGIPDEHPHVDALLDRITQALRAPASARRSARWCARPRWTASSAAGACCCPTGARWNSPACRCPMATAC